MTKLRCCFCQKELEKYYWGDLDCYACPDLACKGYFMTATKDMWQELIRTKELLDVESSEHDLCHDALVERTKELDRTHKALEMALDWLGQVATPAKCDDELCREFTKRKLTEIKTALGQKD